MTVYKVYSEKGLDALLRQLDQESKAALERSGGLCTLCGKAPATLAGANPCFCEACAGAMVEEWEARFSK